MTRSRLSTLKPSSVSFGLSIRQTFVLIKIKGVKWLAGLEPKGKTLVAPVRMRNKAIMQVKVESCADHLGVERPVRLRFDAREVEIVENVDRWYGSDYCYFKIKGHDGNLYILRFDQGRADWELTMFQRPVGPTATKPMPCEID